MTQANFCEQCGAQLEVGSRFCGGCGVKVLSVSDGKRDEPGASPTTGQENLQKAMDAATKGLAEAGSSLSTFVGNLSKSTVSAIGSIADKGQSASGAAHNAAGGGEENPGASRVSREELFQKALKLVANGPTYVGLYIAFMLPTYILPWGGSNSMFNASMSSSGAPGAKRFALFAMLHLGCLVALCLIAWFRGKYVKKEALVVGPILATLFDFLPLLNLIPLIPTALHLFTVIKGASASPPASGGTG